MTLSKQNLTTKVQDALLDYWKEYQQKHGNPPSLYQATKDLHYRAVSSIQRTVDRLVEKGLVKKEPMEGRPGWHIYTAVSEKEIPEV